MITDRDICMATWTRDRVPSAIPISEAMSRELYFAAPDDTISTAENLMRANQVRRLPVLDYARKLVGIVSLADIANESLRFGPRATEPDIAPTAVTATLAGISRPRQNSQWRSSA